MDDLLKSGLINLSEVAARLWPDKPASTRASLLHMKVHRRNRNSLSDELRARIDAILREAFAEFINPVHVSVDFGHAHEAAKVCNHSKTIETGGMTQCLLCWECIEPINSK